MATKYFKKDMFEKVLSDEDVGEMTKERVLSLKESGGYCFHYIKIIHCRKSTSSSKNVLFGARVLISSVPALIPTQGADVNWWSGKTKDFIDEMANNTLHDSIHEITKEEYFDGISGFDDIDVEDTDEEGEFSFDYGNEFFLTYLKNN